MFVERVDVLFVSGQGQLQFRFEEMMHREIKVPRARFGFVFVRACDRLGGEIHELFVSFATEFGDSFRSL